MTKKKRVKAEAMELERQAREGLKERLKTIELAAPEEDYWARLKRELEIINKMGFPGYFLIVSDFIKWTKAEGIPVGPGRGSGAGICGRLGPNDYGSRSVTFWSCCSSGF